MLWIRELEGGCDVGEQYALQHLHRWAEEWDRSVGGAEWGGFAGFGDGNDCGGLPDGGDGCCGYEEVEGVGKVG